MERIFALKVSPLIVFIALLPAAARADSIELTDGKVLDKLTINAARWEAVEYKLEKSPRPASLPGDQVQAVHRDSTLLDGARDALASGDTEKAIKDLGQVGAAAKPWEQAEAQYLIGRAHLLAGRGKEAQEAFKAYLSRYEGEKDWFVPLAVEGLGESLLAEKKPDSAVERFKDLSKYGERWQLISKLGQAQALLESKKEAGAAEARSLFDEVARERKAPRDLRQKAMVGRARALLLQKDPQRAIRELSDEFFSADAAERLSYSAARAEATLLMGQAYLELPGKEGSEEAEIWLLRVPALYRQHAGAYGQACRLLVDLYQKLGNPKREAEWKERLGAVPGASTSSAPAPARTTPSKERAAAAQTDFANQR